MFVIFLMIQVGLLYFLNLLGVPQDINSYFFILMNMIYMITLFLTRYKEISGYLLLGYFSRIFMMLWDLYAKHIFSLPGSGLDSEGFYSTSVWISSNLELLRDQEIYGGFYTKTLGVIFSIIGSNRVLGQYVNVMLGIGIMIYIYKTLKVLEVKPKNIKLAVLITAVFPNALIFSAIFLRENAITFFIAISLYYFSKWYKQGGVANQIYSILAVLVASSFHSGVIGVVIGYLFTYMLYNREKKRFRLSFDSLLLLIAFVFLILVVLNNSDTFLGKFTKVESIDDVIIASNIRSGESQYLMSLKLDTWWKLILYSPIYMFYFLTSPLPWDWRGVGDLVTFFIDSLFYLWVMYVLVKQVKHINKKGKNDHIILGLGLAALITVFIFGIGVTNAGTGMRHRHKILPLFIILVTLINDEDYEKAIERDLLPKRL